MNRLCGGDERWTFFGVCAGAIIHHGGDEPLSLPAFLPPPGSIPRDLFPLGLLSLLSLPPPLPLLSLSSPLLPPLLSLSSPPLLSSLLSSLLLSSPPPLLLSLLSPLSSPLSLSSPPKIPLAQQRKHLPDGLVDIDKIELPKDVILLSGSAPFNSCNSCNVAVIRLNLPIFKWVLGHSPLVFSAGFFQVSLRLDARPMAEIYAIVAALGKQ